MHLTSVKSDEFVGWKYFSFLADSVSVGISFSVDKQGTVIVKYESDEMEQLHIASIHRRHVSKLSAEYNKSKKCR